MKKDYYLIPLIKKILVQFKNTKYFIRIDICQVFYQIIIFEEL